MFEIGHKVKCINADWGGKPRADNKPCPLVLGAVYTVTDIYVPDIASRGADGTTGKHISARLCELHNPVSGHGGFDVRRFRKLPCIKQGMETLIAISSGIKTVKVEEFQ